MLFGRPLRHSKNTPKMARTMVTYSASRAAREPKKEKTQIDRAGRRILEEVSRKVEGEANSCLSFRQQVFSPRPEIVRKLLVYLEKVVDRFPGVPSTVKFKRFSSDDEVLNEVEYEELTFLGFSGHFAMKLLRDEFPTDFFTLETTETGPRLICTRNADEYLLENSSKVRGLLLESPQFLDDSLDLKQSVKSYFDKCQVEDEIVLKVCKFEPQV